MKKFAGRVLIALAVSSLIVTPVYATPSVDDLKEDKAAAKEELESLKDDLAVILNKITEMENKLIAKGEEIAEAAEELKAAEVKEREQYEAMKLRIKYMYEQGDASLVEAFMESDSFTDFVNKAEYVQNVHEYDREQLEAYVETKNQIMELKEQLEEEQKQMEGLQAEYEQSENEINNLIESKKDEISDLNKQIEEEMERIAEEQRRQAEEEHGDLTGGYTYTGTGDTSVAQAIVNAAYGQLGVPYVWGGTSPGSALDCSGLTQYCHRVAGISIPRTSGPQGGGGMAVSSPKPGDIVCYPGHVGIYIGGGKMIHAPHTGDVVRVASVYGSPWYRRYW